MNNSPIIHKFFKAFTNHKKKTKRVIVLDVELRLKYRDHP